VEDLRRKAHLVNGIVYVVIESVYSMDGDEPDLQSFVDICKEFGWHLIVDEAHGLGIRGAKGRGISFGFSNSNETFARVITFGKAAGFHGAAILGSRVLIDYLVNFCRSFIYSTAWPPSDYRKLKVMLEVLLEANQERNQLSMLISHFRTWQLNQSKFEFVASFSPIQNLIVSGNVEVSQLADFLQNNGIDVRPIKSPTVAEGSERLRIILHSFNTVGELDQLTSHLDRYKLG
jgi:8-amino-7-oxononanoate synthase